MNTKACGRAQDRKTVALLAKMGYPSFTISAASAGVFDTISWNDKAVIFVQNKRNDMPPRLELLHLMRCKVPMNSHRFIFLWKTRARKPVVWQVRDTEIVEMDYTKFMDEFDMGEFVSATNS